MNYGGDCRTAPATPGLLNITFLTIVAGHMKDGKDQKEKKNKTKVICADLLDFVCD